MTTLAADTPRNKEVGEHNDIPIIASEICYEGSAIGLVDATGHSRPLVAGDIFLGFQQAKIDNSSGAAADLNNRVTRNGFIKLSVSGAVITDVDQPVYASDDNVFVFNPVGNSFIGLVKRFVSAGVVIVEFGKHLTDPYGESADREIISANKTLDALDTGKTFFVDTDAKTITLPVTATALDCKIVNIGAFGAVAINISPAAADKVMGPDIAGVDNKDLINTKATARRGDFARIKSGHVDGYIVTGIKGTWAAEA